MDYLNLKPPEERPQCVKDAISASRKTNPRITRYNESKYCQKCGCEGKELFEIPFGQKVIRYSSKKSDRRIVELMIKVCKKCKEKYDETIKA